MRGGTGWSWIAAGVDGLAVDEDGNRIYPADFSSADEDLRFSQQLCYDTAACIAVIIEWTGSWAGIRMVSTFTNSIGFADYDTRFSTSVKPDSSWASQICGWKQENQRTRPLNRTTNS